MIIRNPPKLTNRNSVVKYIEIDLWSWLKDLWVGLLNISFQQNFQSFLVENLSIPANTEVSIFNQFRNSYPGNIPRMRIITRQQGDAIIIDGATVWTENNLYLRNVSANDAVVSVLFIN